jgi:hypothetical protein
MLMTLIFPSKERTQKPPRKSAWFFSGNGQYHPDCVRAFAYAARPCIAAYATPTSTPNETNNIKAFPFSFTIQYTSMKLLVLINFLPLLISWANAVMPEESETRTGHLRATREQLPGGGLDPNPDRWIVELRPNATVANTALKLARYNGGRVGYSYNSRAFNGFTITTNNIEDIANNPNVLSVTRDSVAKATGQIIPSGIIRTHASSKNYMKTASDSCLCDAVVAVFDTGVDFDHPDLNVNSAMSVDCTIGNATHRCVQGSGEDDRKGGDDNGHGTHVAGVVAAINNDEGVVGVCPGAEIWSIKVLNSDGVGYWSSILGGLDWATNNADKIDVINLSLGNAGCYVPLCNAIAKAKDAGIAIAVAAGNDNGLASDFMPACCEGVMGEFNLVLKGVARLDFANELTVA